MPELRRETPHGWYIAIGFAIVAILSAGVGVALYELVRIESNLDTMTKTGSTTLLQVNQALTGTHKNGDDGYIILTRRLLQNADGAMNAIKQTSQDANRIAKTQGPKTAALADASVALIQSANGSVVKLNGSIDSLNGVISDVRAQTLPRLNSGVDSLNGLVTDLRPTAKASTALMAQATDDLRSLNGTIVTANAMLSDSEIKTIIHNLALTSANANLTMGNLGLVTMDVHNMLNPKKPTFFEALAITAARSVLGAAAGPLISHFWPLSINVSNTPLPVSVGTKTQ